MSTFLKSTGSYVIAYPSVDTVIINFEVQFFVFPVAVRRVRVPGERTRQSKGKSARHSCSDLAVGPEH